MICSGCRDDLDHCHGVLVVHVDGLAECSEPGCLDLDRVRHSYLVVCEDAPEGRCACLGVAVTRRRRAA